MKIYSVFDPEFKPYGQIVTGMEDTVQQILAALATTPCTENVEYVPFDPVLQELPALGVRIAASHHVASLLVVLAMTCVVRQFFL